MKRIGMIVLLVCLLLSVFVYHPIVSSSFEIPEEYLEAIEGQAKGVYSNTLPLIPICISVDEYVDERVYYTIHYFPFGSVDMSYHDVDGYNIEDPLTGL